MIRAGAALRVLASLAALLTAAGAAPGPDATVGGARLVPLSFTALDGWAQDDHRAAFLTFLNTCGPIVAGTLPAQRTEAADDLGPACRAALDLGPNADAAQAQGFFEAFFRPFEVVPPQGRGFLTGYFEPEYDGSLTPGPDFTTPLLARPDDLVTPAAGETLPGLDPTLRAARRTPVGFEPYPDRAAIEDGALGDRAKPLVYVRDAVAAFIIQVQGSARIRLPDGRAVRVAYAGRNGLPYTSVGRLLVESGRMHKDDMTLDRLMAALRADPDEGRALMRRNRSFIFFRIADELAEADGPIGAAGVPLEPGRSLAVDQNLWRFGLPVWLDGALPLELGRDEPLHRLMIAQDTGSAIVGPARGDFYLGTGAAAGLRAGLLRHPVRFVVLRPKASADAP